MELIKKLIEVSKAIKYLEKDKKNTAQGYKYLSEAKIKETIKSKFEEQGIVFNYSTDEVREYEISPTQKGTKQFVTIAKGSYHFYDSDKDTKLSGTWFGSGSDTGDKGLYKAITGGIKYVLNTNFLIPTGDDPENDDMGNGKSSSKLEPKIIPKVTPTETQSSGNDFDWSKLDLNKIPKWEFRKDEKTGKNIPITPPIIKRLFAIQKNYGITADDYKMLCVRVSNKEHNSQWTYGDIKKIEEELNRVHEDNIAEVEKIIAPNAKEFADIEKATDDELEDFITEKFEMTQ